MPELHLHPDRLRAHALVAAGLADELRAVSAVGASAPSVPLPVADLRDAVCRIAGELAELSAALSAAAAAAIEGDRAAARSLARMRGPW
jgi:hypothetical protein